MASLGYPQVEIIKRFPEEIVTLTRRNYVEQPEVREAGKGQRMARRTEAAVKHSSAGIAERCRRLKERLEQIAYKF